jgi:hypothetical protein
VAYRLFLQFANHTPQCFQKLNWIYTNMPQRAQAKIDVLKELHAGTLIPLGQTEEEFKADEAGPIFL